MDFPIDIVYLWVDDQDPQWIKEKKSWEARASFPCGANNACRFRNNDELRYSLRSLAKNADWIRQIFIVTNGQIPSWLQTDNHRVQIIKHNDIMPADSLPTFNSTAIEAALYNIEGLSEHFLLANDDTFFGKEVSPNFFFNSQGLPILRQIKRNWSDELISSNIYCDNVVYAAHLIKERFACNYQFESHHNIDSYQKTVYKKAFDTFPKDRERTLLHKFRHKSDLHRSIVNYYMIAHNLCQLKILDNIEKNSDSQVLQITSLLELRREVSSSLTKLFCLNDNEFTSPFSIARIYLLLEALFPNKASWEKEERSLNFKEKFLIQILKSTQFTLLAHECVTLRNKIWEKNTLK